MPVDMWEKTKFAWHFVFVKKLFYSWVMKRKVWFLIILPIIIQMVLETDWPYFAKASNCTQYRYLKAVLLHYLTFLILWCLDSETRVFVENFIQFYLEIVNLFMKAAVFRWILVSGNWRLGEFCFRGIEVLSSCCVYPTRFKNSDALLIQLFWLKPIICTSWAQKYSTLTFRA